LEGGEDGGELRGIFAAALGEFGFAAAFAAELGAEGADDLAGVVAGGDGLGRAERGDADLAFGGGAEDDEAGADFFGKLDGEVAERGGGEVNFGDEEMERALGDGAGSEFVGEGGGVFLLGGALLLDGGGLVVGELLLEVVEVLLEGVDGFDGSFEF
jgi:hypothetical protein